MARARKEALVPHSWSLGVALLAFAAYLALTPPVSGDKDSSEFTLVLALLGVAHPTGYPLYTMLGHAWVTAIHALGATWEYAANSWSGLGGAVAIYFLNRLALSLLPAERLGRGRRFVLALLPCAFFALDPVWTYETTLAEVYSWHVAWWLGASVLLLATARAIRANQPLAGRVALWGLACGLGAAHHATSVFLVVPGTIALVLELARAKRFPAAAGLLAFLVPLAAYAYIPWRESVPGAYLWPTLAPGWPGFLAHVTGRQYVHFLGSFAPSAAQRGFLFWYVWPLLVPGLFILVRLAWRSGDLAIRALAAAALAGTAYTLFYGAPDPSSYFMAPMATGLAALAPALAKRGRGLANALAALALALCVAWSVVGASRAQGFVRFHEVLLSMWRVIPEGRGFVFWQDDNFQALRIRQRLYGEKREIAVFNPMLLAHPVARRHFSDQFGFDPVAAGIPLEQHVNQVSPLPVVHFDAAQGQVRLLKKAAP
jgi:hypothetical protein